LNGWSAVSVRVKSGFAIGGTRIVPWRPMGLGRPPAEALPQAASNAAATATAATAATAAEATAATAPTASEATAAITARGRPRLPSAEGALTPG